MSFSRAVSSVASAFRNRRLVDPRTDLVLLANERTPHQPGFDFSWVRDFVFRDQTGDVRASTLKNELIRCLPSVGLGSTKLAPPA